MPVVSHPVIETEEPAEMEQIDEPVNLDRSDCTVAYPELDENLHLSAPAELWSVDSADFNDDGFPDILLSRGVFQSGKPFDVEILLNDQEGSFRVGTDELFEGKIPQTVEPRRVLLADFNGDGRQDVFIADNGKDSDPFPGFQNTLILSAPGGKMVDATGNLPQHFDQTHSASAGDIDGDGDVDLFIGNLGGGGVDNLMLVNSGSGAFSVENERIPAEHIDLNRNWYTSCLFADVNHDSFPDLILGQGNPNQDSHILMNDGTGYFNQAQEPLPPTIFAPQQQIVDIKAGDLTGDGYVDLVLVDTRNSYSGWYVQILENDTDGTFTDVTDRSLEQSGENDPDWVYDVDLLDINWDNALDLVANPMNGQPKFFLNDGQGRFASVRNTYLIEAPSLWVRFDINQDGYDDFFWSYSRSEGVPEIHFVVLGVCR